MRDEISPMAAVPARSHQGPADRHARAELRKLAKAQQRLLPQMAPSVPGFEFAFQYRASYFATGDYYDFIERKDGRLAIFIGDGSGHGPTASMIMATMRAILRTHPELHGEPGATLSAFSTMLRGLIPSDLFMTGLYFAFDGDNRVSWASAGQHPPVRVRRSGDIVRLGLEIVNVPLGILVDEPVKYATIRWTIEPGERLFLFTDGLYEAYNPQGEKFGRNGLDAWFSDARGKTLPETVAGLVDQVEEHLEGADYEDDFTIIGIERTRS